MATSHFDEKSGVVVCPTPWGRWWQTVDEITIEVDLIQGTRAKEVKVEIKPKYIKCQAKQQVIFEGKLHGTVVVDESIWTVEEQQLLRIQLVRADGLSTEKPWTSLLEGQFAPDAWTFHEMQKKLDLERFQIEHPGFDFSGAKLSKTYDNPLPDITNSMGNS